MSTTHLIGIVLAVLGVLAAVFPTWFGPLTGGPEPPVDVFEAVERRVRGGMLLGVGLSFIAIPALHRHTRASSLVDQHSHCALLFHGRRPRGAPPRPARRRRRPEAMALGRCGGRRDGRRRPLAVAQQRVRALSFVVDPSWATSGVATSTGS